MAVKPTKVLCMNENVAYSDWKKEVNIWMKTNIPLGVNKTVLAGCLFGSLTGQARSTVLAQDIDKIICDDGVDFIIKSLDAFFGDDEVLSAFEAQDNLFAFRRKPNTPFKDFVIDFQLRANKVKLSGTDLSDGVLGYYLLKCADLPPLKEELIRATCDKLTLKNVQDQLNKLSLASVPTSSSSGTSVKYAAKQVPGSSSNKFETFYQNKSSSSSSDNDGEDEHHDTFYGRNNRSNFSNSNRAASQTFPLNGKFSNYTSSLSIHTQTS